MSELDVYLASPRGFCAGVRRAIAIVEKALLEYGAPVYVRHEIVHNKHVIKNLEDKGAVFIENLEEVPQNRPVIFSAHGVSNEVIVQAQNMGLKTINATCPLVAKVHNEIKKFAKINMEIIVIGKDNHPEIIGTVGQLDNTENVHIINSIQEAKDLKINCDKNVGFVTQTTLSVDDTHEIIDYLKGHFVNLKSLPKDDICYATTHRQKAIKEIAKKCEFIIIIGSKNSSNSKQLKEVALKNGAKKAFLIDDYSELDFSELNDFKAIGISAGASAPEYLVENLISQLELNYDKINIHNVIIAEENINFKL